MATAGGTRSTIEGASFERGSLSILWLLALATYGVGDVVTTIAIVYFVPVATEANPVVRATFETFGGGGFLALKLIVFYYCIRISFHGGLEPRDRLLSYGAPLLLAAVGTAVTISNLALVFG